MTADEYIMQQISEEDAIKQAKAQGSEIKKIREGKTKLKIGHPRERTIRRGTANKRPHLQSAT